MLIVELSNEAYDEQNNHCGLYIMENGKTTNGRPHWLKGNYSAIWWDDEYSNWKIGKPANLGSSRSILRSQSNNSAHLGRGFSIETFARVAPPLHPLGGNTRIQWDRQMD